MEFCVISRMKAEQLCKVGFGLYFMKPAVISLFDPGEEDGKIDFSRLSNRVFYAAVPDIGFDDLADCGYTLDTFFPEAEELARFVKQAARDGYDFICRCEYGERYAPLCASQTIGVHYMKCGLPVPQIPTVKTNSHRKTN